MIETKRRLKHIGKAEYSIEAVGMLEAITGLGRVAQVLEEDRIVSVLEEEKLERFLLERENHRPLQYILGTCEFMGLSFAVGEGVLIPRSDTEVLVEAVLEILGENETPLPVVLDMCTGSGCIAISLAKHGRYAVLGADISPAALSFARRNAQSHGVGAELFIESDLFAAVPQAYLGRLDAVVSNPPYIKGEEIPGLMPEVSVYEPLHALDGGADGLDFYRRLIAEARAWLTAEGWLFFEIGYDQGADVVCLMEQAGYEACEVRQDLAGLDRVVLGRKKR